ncbi:MAG TPA: putative sulfate exporter family transporter [Solirubrobacteraceae bacterium]|nr:putative sulfate exporter family transporter [Solirubrobacteraceae bacterium]
MTSWTDLHSGTRRSLRSPSLAGGAVAGRALAEAGAVAAVALALGSLAPRIGGPIIALALGMVTAAVMPAERQLRALGSISQRTLKLAIVLLGAGISLAQVVKVGVSSLPVMLGSLAVSLLTAALIGRRLGVTTNLRALVGVGTGICGASAIAAVSGVIDADAREIRYAVSTIFVFNLAAVLLFPTVGHLFGMGSHEFGLWSGTAVNDTSSVLAAGFAYSHAAGNYALIVKLTRTTMIIPITLYLAAATHRRHRQRAASAAGATSAASAASAAGAEAATGAAGTVPDVEPARRSSLRSALPWFLVWFAAASAANSVGLFSASTRAELSRAGLVLTTLALAAIGRSTNLRELRGTGPRPLILGALVWAAVALSSLCLQRLTGLA